MTAIKKESEVDIVTSVTYLRGLDINGKSVKIATSDVTGGINWYGNE